MNFARAGHQIGNHGYDHSKRELRRQVQQCDRALQRLGITTSLFRPPGGALGMSDLLWLMREGYSTVMWSLDAVDSMREEGKWHGEAPDYSVVAGGDIVLMHDDNAVCLRDLPGLLETLTRKRLQPELVSRLIEYPLQVNHFTGIGPRRTSGGSSARQSGRKQKRKTKSPIQATNAGDHTHAASVMSHSSR